MPGVYHKYVGHDNNRDFVTLSQEDTKVIARIYNLDWYPSGVCRKTPDGINRDQIFCSTQSMILLPRILMKAYGSGPVFSELIWLRI